MGRGFLVIQSRLAHQQVPQVPEIQMKTYKVWHFLVHGWSFNGWLELLSRREGLEDTWRHIPLLSVEKLQSWNIVCFEFVWDFLVGEGSSYVIVGNLVAGLSVWFGMITVNLQPLNVELQSKKNIRHSWTSQNIAQHSWNLLFPVTSHKVTRRDCGKAVTQERGIVGRELWRACLRCVCGARECASLVQQPLNILLASTCSPLKRRDCVKIKLEWNVEIQLNFRRLRASFSRMAALQSRKITRPVCVA